MSRAPIRIPAATSMAVSLVATLLGVAIAALSPDATLAGEEHSLTGLQVLGGEGWHADDRFVVEWNRPPSQSGRVHYAIRTADGEPIPGYEEQTTDKSVVADQQVPATPGVYLFEAWLPKSAPARVQLRFDDGLPPPVIVGAPAWLAAGEDLHVHLSRPGAPLPISGLSGYAVTLDADPDGRPCALMARCRADELILDGDPTEFSHTFPSPPEGVSFVHAVAVSGSGMASNPVATARIAIDGTPPAVRLEGAPSGWATAAMRVTALATDPLSGMAPDGAAGPITALAIDEGVPLVVPGAVASATVKGEGVHTVHYYGRDAVGNSGDGSLPFTGPGAATVRIDESGPTVRFAAPDPTDPERIAATVVDRLSGPDPDRGAIGVRRVGSSSPFRPLPTAVAAGHLVARWDSDDDPLGEYEFRATGFDVAGNAATSSLGAAGSRFVLRNPVKRVTQLAFGFGAERLVFQRCRRTAGARRCRRTVVSSFARRPAGRTVPCCHGALVGGRLVDAAGEPLAGQTVAVVETFPQGARNRLRRTDVTTGPDGRFSTRLAPGASREVTAEFPGTRLLTRALGRPLRLRVRTGVRLRVSTAHVEVGGTPVVFSGRISHPEASLPTTGLPVELEFRLPGMPWTEFRTVQSDAAGNFRYPYTFSDDDSAGVRFLFRAFVPATGGWPFAPTTSRPLAVTG